MILSAGEYIHIIHRQLFPNDAQRHFVGTVESHEGNLVRVKGYLFALERDIINLCAENNCARESFP